ncbi:MAG: acyl-CoA dehydrogenase [Nocardioidaceae bacterium]|nr:acyl-CoA dehydrogenase [Nocardioidaceae bacterium]
MPWSLTDEQLAYQEAFRDWLAKVADTAAVRAWLDDGDAASFGARLASDGWSGVGIPETYDGQGGGLVELALTAEELGRAAAPSSAWLAAVISAPLVEEWSDDGLTVLLVPADAVPHLAPALSLDGDRVSGRVGQVLAGAEATRFVVPVDGGLRLVDASEAELTPRKLLDRSRTAADVVLDGAPSEPLTGRSLLEASARTAVLVAADALGASARMLDLAVEYAGQRKQFGVPIGSFQAVKHAAATMLVGIEAARSVVPFAAASVDVPADDRDPQWLLHAAAVKSQVTAEAARAADSALTLHGAIGYTWEHDLQLFYKRAKLDAVLGGTSGAWDDVIADGLDLA